MDYDYQVCRKKMFVNRSVLAEVQTMTSSDKIYLSMKHEGTQPEDTEVAVLQKHFKMRDHVLDYLRKNTKETGENLCFFILVHDNNAIFH